MPKLFSSCVLLVQLIGHDHPRNVPLKRHHHPHAAPVGFIPDISNALYLFMAHQLSDLFYQPGLVHLIGQFGDHEGFSLILFIFLHGNPTSNSDHPPARFVRLVNPLFAVYDTGG